LRSFGRCLVLHLPGRSPTHPPISPVLPVLLQSCCVRAPSQNEIEAALDREVKQLERIEWARNKAQTDAAYYKSLERMLEEERRKNRSMRSS
jgi:hypothetical protein